MSDPVSPLIAGVRFSHSEILTDVRISQMESDGFDVEDDVLMWLTDF